MIACCDIVTTVQILWSWNSFFVKELLKTFECDDTIRFNQWVSTDSQLKEQESAFDGFIDDLVKKFLKLTEHHYIAK